MERDVHQPTHYVELAKRRGVKASVRPGRHRLIEPATETASSTVSMIRRGGPMTINGTPVERD